MIQIQEDLLVSHTDDKLIFCDVSLLSVGLLICCFLLLVDFHYKQPYWSNQQVSQSAEVPAPSSSCRFKDRGSAPAHHDLLTHDQLRGLGLTNTCTKSRTAPDRDRCSTAYTPPTPPSPPPPSSHSYTGSGLVPREATPTSTCLLGSRSTPLPQ